MSFMEELLYVLGGLLWFIVKLAKLERFLGMLVERFMDW